MNPTHLKRAWNPGGIAAIVMLIGLLPISAMAADAPPTVQMPREAVTAVKVDGESLLRFQTNAWGHHFAWQATTIAVDKNAPKTPGTSEFFWNTPAAKIFGKLTLTQPSPHALQWDWVLSTTQAQAADPAGPNASPHAGLSFTFDLDSLARRGCKAVPQLKADKTGFTWEMLPGQVVKVEFSQPLASLFFEPTNHAVIQAMLYQAPYDAGKLTQTMTITMPDDGVVSQSLSDRFNNVNTAGWFTGALDDRKSFIDLSDLNDKPAGTHGFLQCKDGHFQFSDGTPARFWGGAVAAYALYARVNGKTDYAGIDAQAKRMAQLGFNIVRFTHVDSTWVDPNMLKRGLNRSDTLDDAALDCMFYWMKALKDQGIYVVVDMATYRGFYPGDNIPGWSEIHRNFNQGARDGSALGQGFSYLSDRIQELWQTTSKDLVSRVNPYTKLAIKDDPDVAAIILWNENDFTTHFGLLPLADKGNPFFRQIFLTKLDAFAKQYSLDPGPLGMTWLNGPDKLLTNDIEYHVNRTEADFLRAQGVKVPLIAGHIWGNMSADSLPALTAGDVIDTHAYDGSEFLRRNPRIAPNDFMTCAQAALADHPKFISEYDSADGSLSRDRYTIPIYAATLSAFQDYDGFSMFAYSQSGVGPTGVGMWDTYNNPQVMGMEPVSALIYRMHYVSPARQMLYVPLTEETGLFHNVSVARSLTLRTAFETHGIRLGFEAIKELPWFTPTVPPKGAQVITDLQQDFIPTGPQVTSDTGQFTRNWVKGQFIVNAPNVQLVMGAISGDPIQTADATFTITSPQGAVALCSLDRQPLKQSHRILLSTSGRVMPAKGNMAYMSEPVAGTIRLTSAVPNLQLIPLKGDGTHLPAIALPSASGAYTIDLPTNLGTHWFELDAQ